MIQEIEIKSSEDLIQKMNELPNHYIYRGHSDAGWKLESTLERVLGQKWSAPNARKFEEHSYNTFKSKYHIYNSTEHSPQSKLSWLSVMQHYGVPTRLLDFTESPYVALYFALETYNPLLKKNFAIFAVDYTAVMNNSIDFIKKKDAKFVEAHESIQHQKDEIFDETVDRFSYDILWVTEPIKFNARMDRQSGTFLISGNREKTVESLILSGLYDNCSIIKYVIHSDLYESVYALLRKMSINSKSIYGDLSGLAKAIKMEMQVYTI
ncbi:MAG: FRG domain-containing protein [Victivallaceae bacterium]